MTSVQIGQSKFHLLQVKYSYLASIDNWEGILVLLGVGAIFIVISYIYPRHLNATWFTTDSETARSSYRIVGILLIVISILILFFG